MSESPAAGWPSEEPTAAQLKELFDQIQSGRVTKKRLQGFLRGYGYENPLNVLGNNFVRPEEVALASPVQYTEKELLALSKSIPEIQVLEELARRDCILLPGPPSPLSYKGAVHALGGVLHESPDFPVDDSGFVAPGWLAVCRELQSNIPPGKNFGVDWNGWMNLLRKHEEPADIAEAVWTHLAFYLTKQELVIPQLRIYTSTKAPACTNRHEKDFPRASVRVFSSNLTEIDVVYTQPKDHRGLMLTRFKLP